MLLERFWLLALSFEPSRQSNSPCTFRIPRCQQFDFHRASRLCIKKIHSILLFRSFIKSTTFTFFFQSLPTRGINLSLIRLLYRWVRAVNGNLHAYTPTFYCFTSYPLVGRLFRAICQGLLAWKRSREGDRKRERERKSWSTVE